MSKNPENLWTSFKYGPLREPGTFMPPSAVGDTDIVVELN